jgi:hypothetical protein
MLSLIMGLLCLLYSYLFVFLLILGSRKFTGTNACLEWHNVHTKFHEKLFSHSSFMCIQKDNRAMISSRRLMDNEAITDDHHYTSQLLICHVGNTYCRKLKYKFGLASIGVTLISY